MHKRQRLLEKCLDYFLGHGVADLSLRPLAAAVGTSARMLLHYFGSKEALISAVMREQQAQFQRTFAGLQRDLRGKPPENLLETFWKALSSKANRPALRLLFEVQMLALQNPRRYRRYLRQTSTSWRELIGSALPTTEQPAAMATLYNAVVDGLLLELLSTGDIGRTSRALKVFSNQCRPSGPRKRKKARR